MSTTILARLEEVVFCFARDALDAEATTDEGKPRPSLRKYFPGDTGKRTPLGALRVAYLASLAHSHILQGKLLTKRDIYYMCRALFASPASVDRALDTLSEGLQVPRNELNIVAAPKGIVSGNVAFVDEAGHAVNVGMFGPDGCLIPPRPERMREVVTDACAVVVIEKEAAFHSLLNEPAAQQLLQTCIFVTGKGYPDFASRSFLAKVSEAQRARSIHLPIYVLTDADPHGISIAHCYIRDLPNCHVRWVGVRPSDSGSLFNLSTSALMPISSTENALLEGMLKRMPKSAGDEAKAIAPLIAELNVLKATGTKFEMEALAAEDFGSNISGLLRYLLDRTQSEFSEYTTSGSAYCHDETVPHNSVAKNNCS